MRLPIEYKKKPSLFRTASPKASLLQSLDYLGRNEAIHPRDYKKASSVTGHQFEPNIQTHFRRLCSLIVSERTQVSTRSRINIRFTRVCARFHVSPQYPSQSRDPSKRKTAGCYFYLQYYSPQHLLSPQVQTQFLRADCDTKWSALIDHRG